MIPDHIVISKIENNLSEIIKSGNYSKVAFLLDKNTFNHCFTKLSNHINFNYEKIIIDEGEENKNLLDYLPTQYHSMSLLLIFLQKIGL